MKNISSQRPNGGEMVKEEIPNSASASVQAGHEGPAWPTAD